MRRSLRIFVAALAVAAHACRGRTTTTSPTVGFWYESSALALPSDVTDRLGGPLTDDESALVRQISAREIERAFSGLRLAIGSTRDAFWRVQVLQTLPVRFHQKLPTAGESLALGPLGGSGSVDLEVVSTKAIRFAPAGASRREILEGIGRGVGRTAVHELTHLMLGASTMDNRSDVDSYEYHSADRRSQYYGDLHWTAAWPLLHAKFGG
jgi:hypothetical protein